MKIRFGTRGSRLALLQVDEILRLLKKKRISITFEVISFTTKGDIDKKTPLTEHVANDFFTDTLDRALLEGEIDIAIHSAKDLPQKLHPGLEIYALTHPLDETDALVSSKKLADLPKRARVATSSILRKNEIKKLRPDIQLVNIRGNIDERLAKLDKGKVDALVVATCALIRLGLKHRIAEILPYEATPLQGQLAVVGCRRRKKLKKYFTPINARRHYGKVVIVGAGPGDKDLITVKGKGILQKADVVFYDYLIPKGILAYAPHARKVYVGKRKGEKALPQEELNRQLRKATQDKNKLVVRLKGGDPLIFGRGMEEASYLKAYHIPTEIIPGVSSATGLPSYLGIPLTARGISSSVVFLSAYNAQGDSVLSNNFIVPKAETIVFLMGLTRLPQIVKRLIRDGWAKDTPVVVISQGMLSGEKVVKGNLSDITRRVRQEGIKPPALIIVGKVVDFWEG